MIKYLDTSIFDSPSHTLVNPVNTVGAMGKGLALEFRRRWPEVYQRYKTRCLIGFDIGTLQFIKMEHHTVINFPTKKHWMGLSRQSYIQYGLEAFVRAYTVHEVTDVAFPWLGCGEGGLNWESQVKPLMVKHLGNLPITVYIHGGKG